MKNFTVTFEVTRRMAHVAPVVSTEQYVLSGYEITEVLLAAKARAERETSKWTERRVVGIVEQIAE